MTKRKEIRRNYKQIKLFTNKYSITCDTLSNTVFITGNVQRDKASYLKLYK